MITPEILQKFCTQDQVRYALTLPFTVGEYTYATDGRVCIRVPSQGAEQSKNTPNVSVLQWPHAAVTDWQPIEAPTAERISETCRTCKGLGSFLKCDKCEGNGHCECECGDEHDCHKCRGIGSLPSQKGEPCEVCHGEKIVFESTAIPVRGGTFADLYICKILEHLENVEFAPCHAADAGVPASFRFTGGEGLLMPLRVKGSC